MSKMYSCLPIVYFLLRLSICSRMLTLVVAAGLFWDGLNYYFIFWLNIFQGQLISELQKSKNTEKYWYKDIIDEDRLTFYILDEW